jgi:polar amino acid transport system substrate-binding protein
MSASAGCASVGDVTHEPSVVVAGLTITRDDALHALLPSEIGRAGVIRVATSAPYPPMEMFGPGGEIVGLDRDIATAIGLRLGIRVTFTQQKFDGIILAIMAGRFDAAMSAMTDTRARRKVLTFVDYAVSGTGFLVLKGNPERIRTERDLCGVTVAVQSGTTQSAYLAARLGECPPERPVGVLAFPDQGSAELAVINGKAVAAVMDKPVATHRAASVDRGTRFETVNDPAARSGYQSASFGIGVDKQAPDLAVAIQAALQSLIDDGSYGRILRSYGLGYMAVRTATLKAGA